MESNQTKGKKKSDTLRTPIGTRDFLPEDMIAREYVIGIVKKVFEEYGYDPMETPAIELGEVLKGKYGEEERLIYEFKDRGGRDLALRYDLTVPLSRVVASNPQLPKPFKRYQISRVWRYDNPQRGRYREFWQCDVDIVGSKSMLADAEVIMVAVDVFRTLGFRDFQIKIGNRKILDAICSYAGIEESRKIEALRSLDKVDKIGVQGIAEELKQKGFPDECVEKILESTQVKGKPNDVLSYVSTKLSVYRQAVEGAEELREIVCILEQLGVEEKSYSIDLGLARGLDYYTGSIFEIAVTEPKIGSLAGGGRYDKLIATFAGVDVPATGISFGLERIIDVMREMGMVSLPKTKTMVVVSSVDEESSLEALRIAQRLRRAGISVRTDVMGERNITRQLKYADSIGVPYAIIVGRAEIEKAVFKLKLMEKREEKEMKMEEIIEFLNDKLRRECTGSQEPS
nr:histidine--tRNA ligase [Candidatus Njordarchaeum guaymaensis]